MMEDKLKRYEKIEFLGEGQVAYVFYIFNEYSKRNSFKNKLLRNVRVVYLSDNRERLGVIFRENSRKIRCSSSLFSMKNSN